MHQGSPQNLATAAVETIITPISADSAMRSARIATRRDILPPCITLSLPKRCNITPRDVHERFQTLLTPVLTLFTDFLSAVVTSEIAQIL